MINHTKLASKSFSDFNAFSLIVSIAESGSFYRPKSQTALNKIIRIAKIEMSRCLLDYDVELEMSNQGVKQ
jgi:hypothetical protein